MSFFSNIKSTTCMVAPIIAAGLALSSPVVAQSAKPWMNTSLSAEKRAELLEKEMTQDERLSMVIGIMANPAFLGDLPEGIIPAAGYIPGVPRLGIPAQYESDASMGVTNPGRIRPDDVATALPSSQLLAATFNTRLAYNGGAVVGTEARAKGFNVQLAGGVNLARDPRNGRNFEYAGEDPYLAGQIVGHSVKGIQSQNIIATVKHFAVNGQETNRNFANSIIEESANRESDLLAFQIAIEIGKPGSVMCAYNLINGIYACGHDHLQNKVLKGDWGYKGYVMSDWGSVKATDFAIKGLDQQSGSQLDKQPWFGAPLKAAVESGEVPASRLSDMVRRILFAMFDVGLFEKPVGPHVSGHVGYDAKAHAQIARDTAAEGIVLLKNEGNVLPVAATAKKILVVGGYADTGVLSGGGSSQVLSEGDTLSIPQAGEGMLSFFTRINYHNSQPLAALRAVLPNAEIAYDMGNNAEEVRRKAKNYDVVIVFANQWMGEALDAPNLDLPHGQNALIDAAASSNSKTIVVLQTGGPVNMPWLNKVPAVVAAWYPGQEGGEAIADILTGKVNPSGHLPQTFPQSVTQFPRGDAIPGIDLPDGVQFDVVYDEGSDVGYRYFAKHNLKALFPFGHGLSYTTFDYSDVKVTGGDTVTVSFKVTNTGSVAGKDAPQVYLNASPSEPVKRLIGFTKVDLQPGQSTTVTLSADPRLLAEFDVASNSWVVAGGDYTVAVAKDAEDTGTTAKAKIKARKIKP